MRTRLGTALLGCTLLVASLAAAPAAQAAPAAHRNAAVRFVPAVSGHIMKSTLSFPPTTAYCRANIGIACYRPSQFQKAYNLGPLYRDGITGAGRTIVIVDAFGSPTIKADLKVFDQTFGLPDPPKFDVIEPAGAVPPFPEDPYGKDDRSGWGVETTLDVEYAHAIAPGANILLVATPQSETEGVQGLPQIVAAENYVLNHNLGDVITQSFGATENTFPSKHRLLKLRSAVKKAYELGVPMLAASGDQGATDTSSDLSSDYPFPVNSWPSADPLTTSIGGTQLNLDGAGKRLSPDVPWNQDNAAGGGGPSHVFARPAFQDPVANVVGDSRGTPDISMSAAVDGGAVFYYSFCDYGRPDPTTGQPPLCGPQWHIVGGTSEASPLFAGIIALADQAAGHRIGQLNPTLYSLGTDGGPTSVANGLVDVTTGDNSVTVCTANCGLPNEVDTFVQGFPSLVGYDMVTGLGTVNGNRFVHRLAASTG